MMIFGMMQDIKGCVPCKSTVSPRQNAPLECAGRCLKLSCVGTWQNWFFHDGDRAIFWPSARWNLVWHFVSVNNFNYFRRDRMSDYSKAIAKNLMRRDTLGRDFFKRGMPEPVIQKEVIIRHANLLDLFKAYCAVIERRDLEIEKGKC